MKKQIMSLLILASVFGTFSSAKADETMTVGLESNPWEQCTADELLKGCVKQYDAQTNNAQEFKLPKSSQGRIEVIDRNCERYMNVRMPQGYTKELGAGMEIYDSGTYMIINNSPYQCQVKLSVQGR